MSVLKSETAKMRFQKLHQSFWISLGAFFWMVTMSLSQDALANKDTYQAQTAANPGIPIPELEWMVKPLTQEELTVEADAWQRLLKEKVKAISVAEIANRRLKDQIKKTEEAADAFEKAQAAASKANIANQDASSGPDSRTSKEAAKVTADAVKKVEEAQKVLEEADEARKRIESDADVSNATQQAVEMGNENVGDGNQQPEGPSVQSNTPPEISSESELADTLTEMDAGQLKQVSESVKAVAESSANIKEKVLDNLTDLRTQRSALVSRFTVVIDELESKGGDVASYKQYRKAVGALNVDVSDTSAFAKFATGWLTSEEGGMKWAINIIKFFVIIGFFYFIALVVGTGVSKITSKARRMSGLLRNFLNKAVQRGVLFIGVLVAFDAIDIPVAPLLAVIGAAGFVVGFALQGTLSNFASGLLILIYRPFDVGDAVEAGGTSGVINTMNLMYTKFKTWDNKSMIVPNNKIWGDTITNISGTDKRRVDMVFGISYSDSIDKAQAILEKIVKEHPLTLDDPAPNIKLNELGDSSVNFIVRPWVAPANYWAVYWDITRKVKEEFDQQGISIPFPQRDVHIHQQISS